MKIILTDIQYNTLKEMTEESLRNFLYKLWDTQKKRGEEPSLDDIIYQVTEIDRDTREDYSTIRPIWYRYNGGFNKLFKKLKDEIRKCIPLCANCHREYHFFENLKNGNENKDS